MHLAFEVVPLLVATAVVSGLAGRVGVSAPLILTALGIVASFVPGVPEYAIDPELVLVGILPPLLYATALRTPIVALRQNRRAIGLLSIVLVVVTAFAVAVVVHWLLPGIPFAAAVALGAVVAPPDAVAASAIARAVNMPRKVVILLEGESLLNDATALVLLRTAIAALGGAVTVAEVSGDFARAVLVGIGVGWLVVAVLTPVRRLIRDPVLDTSLALLIPYLAYLPAEHYHGSGVIAVVVAGILLGHRAPDIQSPASRVTERTLWRSIQFMLEGVVFLLIGLQLRALLDDAVSSRVTNLRIAVVCAAVFATVVVVRLVWVFPATYLPRLSRRVREAEPDPPARRAVFLVGWAGMRGVVTLAAAFTLTAETVYPEVLLIAAFTVVAGTLLVQGTSLPWLVRRLRVPGPDPTQDVLQQAQLMQRAVESGVRRLDEVSSARDAPGTADDLRNWGERVANAAWERLGAVDGERDTPAVTYRRLRTAMLGAERDVVVAAQRDGTVAHEIAERIMERLDQEEAALAIFGEDPPVNDDDRTTVAEGACEHLSAVVPPVAPDDADACGDCLALGEHDWVHLRMCLSCGHVACCDSSPRRHASAHHAETAHPVMRSIELGETWRWCFEDSLIG